MEGPKKVLHLQKIKNNGGRSSDDTGEERWKHSLAIGDAHDTQEKLKCLYNLQMKSDTRTLVFKKRCITFQGQVSKKISKRRLV